MKIAIVCQNYPPATFEGGISHYSELLAKNLLLRGHEVYALTSTEFTQPIKESEGPYGIEIIRIEGPWNHVSVKKIRKIIIKKKIDAIILQYAPASFKKSFRIKWAVSRFPCQKITAFHTLWGKSFDRILGFFMLFGSDKIIATNSEIVSILERRLSFFLKKTYWIPIGSNILPCSQKEQEIQFFDPLISYFGMLYPGKGLDLILDTLEGLKKRGQRFFFKFIGGGILYYPSYETDFCKIIEKRKLSDMVEHLGQMPAEDVSKWLSKSRFIFLPYDRGLSDRRGSFMAAIVHGKAVLTSPPIVPMPFLKNGINVIWPNETSLDAYIEITERLLRDDEMIAKLEQGAKELSRRFRWEKIAAEYEMVLCAIKN